MHLSAPPSASFHSAPPQLEDTLAEVESRLAALGAALRTRDAAAIDLHAGELHGALAKAVEHFASAARIAPVPPALRTRLASASGEVAAQRESLARATAALDRAIDVLLPREPAKLYSAFGGAERSLQTGVVSA
jgi:hypothetical protein